MRPDVPQGWNIRYTAPKDWDAKKHGPCDDVFAIGHDHTITTIWSPSVEELAMLTNGGYVMLVLASKVMVPVIVTACTQAKPEDN